MKRFLVTCILLVGIALIFTFSSRPAMVATPPVLQMNSNLSAFLSGTSNSLAEFNQAFICSDDDTETVSQTDDYTIIYSNRDNRFSDFLSRVSSTNGKFRFLSFLDHQDSNAFTVSPIEFFRDNFVFDLESDGYCCNALSPNSSIAKNNILLVYSDSDFRRCANPTQAEMSAANLTLDEKGWNLLYVASSQNLTLPDNLAITTIWSFPASSEIRSELLWVTDSNLELPFDNNIYWILVDDAPTPATDTSTSSNQPSGNNSATSNAGTTVDNNAPLDSTTPVVLDFDVSIKDFRFSLEEIRATQGSVVNLRITNEDSAPHDFEITDLAKNSGILRAGESTTLSFTVPNTPGEFGISCTLHPNMTNISRFVVE